MTPAIEAARTALQSQLSPIARQLDDLESKATDLRNQKVQLEAALKALDAPAKAASKPKRKPSQPAAKKQEVITACRRLLAREHALTADELERRVGEALKASGRTLAGYALRFKEAMQNEAFETADDGVVVLVEAGSGSRRKVAVSKSQSVASN